MSLVLIVGFRFDYNGLCYFVGFIDFGVGLDSRLLILVCLIRE